MRVKVVTILEVDPKKWNEEYWTADKADEIRDQVQGMAQDAVRDGLRHLSADRGGSGAVEVID